MKQQRGEATLTALILTDPARFALIISAISAGDLRVRRRPHGDGQDRSAQTTGVTDWTARTDTAHRAGTSVGSVVLRKLGPHIAERWLRATYFSHKPSNNTPTNISATNASIPRIAEVWSRSGKTKLLALRRSPNPDS
jgi:hypothetical protein